MQKQSNQNEGSYKMSHLEEYRLWAMICDNELNAEINESQSMAFLSASQANGGNQWLSERRSRFAN